MRLEESDQFLALLCQVNANVEGLRVSLDGVVRIVGDQEVRLRRLEGWKHSLTPILTAITFVAGVAATVAVELLL